MNRILCFVLLFSLGPAAQAQLFPKRHFHTEDGLVQKQITTLYEDSKGAMWIGTKGGLSRFDGHNINSWTVVDGLVENYIKSITEDAAGRILAFSDTGITRIGKDSVERIYSGQSFFTSIAYGDALFYSYFIGHGKHLELWILDPSGKLRKFPFRETFGEEPGSLWKDTDKNIVLLKDSQRNYYQLVGGIPQKIMDRTTFPYLNCPDTQDDVLLNKFRYLFTNSSGTGFLPFDHRSGNAIYHPAVGFISYINSPAGLLTITTQYGSEKIDYSFNYITCLFLDQGNQVWVGTENGLVVFHHLLFRNYISSQLLADPWSICESPDGTIYIGNYSQGIAEIEKGQLKASTLRIGFPLNKTNQHALNYIYHGGLKGFNQEIYLNSSKGVLTIEDGRIFRSVPLPQDSAVYCSVKDTLHNRILFSSFRQGLYAWYPDHHLEKIVNNTNKAFDQIYSIDCVEPDRIIFGSPMCVATIKGNKVEVFRDANNDTLQGAYSIARDSRGGIWFGNDFGLFVCRDNILKQVKHEFINGAVRSLKALDHDRLLIGSSKGIGILWLDQLYGTDSVLIKSYDYRNGFEIGEVSINGFHLDHSGKIWIAGARGVVRMDPDWIKPYTFPIHAEITKVRISYEPDQTIMLKPDPDGEYVTTNKCKGLRIDFNSIDTKTPLKDVYKYRLKGHTSSWSSPSEEMSASFSDLNPGYFEFELMVRNVNGFWNPEPIILRFRILPGWYQTLFFKITLISLLVVLVVLITFYLTRRSHKSRLLKITQAQELAELRLQAIRSQLEPHFVFNVLNSIGYAIQAKETDMAYEYLTRFSSLMRRWLKGSELSLIMLSDEIQMIQEYLMLEKFRYENRLTFEVDIEEGLALDFKVPRMILQIPVENAVKHGISNMKDGGHLIVQAKSHKDSIKLIIEDNGIGRTAADLRPATGNQKGQKLVEKMLNYIREFQGFQVSYNITDLYHSDDSPAGTRVEITILGILKS